MYHYAHLNVAAQMWLLGRVVPYLIGEHISDSDKHWQNFL